MYVKNESWMKDRYMMAVRCTEAALRTFMAQNLFDPDAIYERDGLFTIIWGWPDSESFAADREQRESMYAVMDSLDPLCQKSPFLAWYEGDAMYNMIVYGRGVVMDERSNACERGTVAAPRLKVSLLVPGGEVDDVSYLKDERDTLIYVKGSVNTLIQYSSRSCRNPDEEVSYKAVFRGRLSKEDIDRIEESLNCDGCFVPSQVSLPNSSHFDWFGFSGNGISETADLPTENISAKKFARKFIEAGIKGWSDDLPFA